MIKKCIHNEAINKFIERLDLYKRIKGEGRWRSLTVYYHYTYCEKLLCFFICFIQSIFTFINNVIAFLTVPIWCIPYIFIKYGGNKNANRKDG